MLTVSSCGYQYTHPDGLSIQRPQGLEDYVFLSLHTPAIVRTEYAEVQKEFRAERGECLILRQGAPHWYHSLEQPFVNDWIHFRAKAEDGSPDEAELFLERLRLPLNEPFRAPNPFLISSAVLGLQNELAEYGPLNAPILDTDLRSLLMKLSALRNQASPVGGPEIAERYRGLLSGLRGELIGSPWRHPSVDELAKRAQMSPSHFQHIWRALFGVSVGRDMTRSRLDYAKYLLAHSGDPVVEISRLCGYENEVHFMRIFKKHLGQTPSEYRLAAKRQLKG